MPTKAKIIDVTQGTDEWLEHRSTRIGASDVAAILDISPWETPLEFWKRRMGDAPELKVHPGMMRGHKLEPICRAKCEEWLETKLTPLVGKHYSEDWALASWDGVNLESDIIVEMKAPSKEVHMKAVEGEIPAAYIAQIRHQKWIYGPNCTIYYASYHPECTPDFYITQADSHCSPKEVKKQTMYVKEWYYTHLIGLEQPPMGERDLPDMGDNEEWMDVAESMRHAQQQEKIWRTRKETFRDELARISNNRSCKGGRYKFTSFVKQGSIDYAIIPALKDVDLEQYRRRPSEGWRLSEMGE